MEPIWSIHTYGKYTRLGRYGCLALEENQACAVAGFKLDEARRTTEPSRAVLVKDLKNAVIC